MISASSEGSFQERNSLEFLKKYYFQLHTIAKSFKNPHLPKNKRARYISSNAL